MTHNTDEKILNDTKQEAIRQVKISFADRYMVEYVTSKWGVNSYTSITLADAINYINKAKLVKVDSGDIYLDNASIMSRDVS